MTFRHVHFVIETDLVCSRIVFGRQKPGVLWNINTAPCNLSTHWIAVRHRGKSTSVWISMAPTAGSAIQRCRIGIIIRGTSMTAEYNKAAEVLSEPYHAQATFNKVCLLLY